MPSANSTADRAIEILLMFGDDCPTISAAAVSQQFEMPRSTTYRYLSSLRSRGLIVDAGESSFRLGPRIFDLARVARRGYSVLQVAEPALRRLNKSTGETVLMAQISGIEISVLECIESSGPMRISYNRGQVLSTPATACAKVFMAFGDPKVAQTILRRRRFDRYTEHTIVDPDEIARDIERVKAQGFALNRDEVDEGVSAIAAPILTPRSIARYAVSIALPSFRATGDKLLSLAHEVRSTAGEIAASIGEA